MNEECVNLKINSHYTQFKPKKEKKTKLEMYRSSPKKVSYKSLR